MICPHCNQYHTDDTVFCPNTGKKIYKLNTSKCIKCNKLFKSSDKFCAFCGERLSKETQFLQIPTVPIISSASLSCPICHSTHYSTSSYCSTTGGRIISELVCTTCAKEGILTTAKFCPKCGRNTLRLRYKTDPAYLSYEQHQKLEQKRKNKEQLNEVGRGLSKIWDGIKYIGKGIYAIMKFFG